MIKFTTSYKWCVPYALSVLNNTDYNTAVKRVKRELPFYSRLFAVESVYRSTFTKIIEKDFNVEYYNTYHDINQWCDNPIFFGGWKITHSVGTYAILISKDPYMDAHVVVYKDGVLKDALIDVYNQPNHYPYDDCVITDVWKINT